MTATQTQSTGTQGNKGKITGADVAKAGAAAAAATVGRVAPWEDLKADPTLQKEPRKNSTIDAALTLLRERGPKGAKLEEIQSALEKIGFGHHDAKALLRWMSANRGWGFHMKKDDHIVLRTKAEE